MKIKSDQRTWCGAAAQKSNFHAFSHAREKSERYVKSRWRFTASTLFFSFYLYLFIFFSSSLSSTCRDTRVGFITITIAILDADLLQSQSCDLSHGLRQFPYRHSFPTHDKCFHLLRSTANECRVVVSYWIYRRVEVFFAAESAHRFFFERFS